mmetsp:Transcript_8654/g.11829  ORF Transcript_8654/g.11829 Transcript_8654/m.11829 type:complete len:83 (+) Transcript_8654:177-425(+)
MAKVALLKLVRCVVHQLAGNNSQYIMNMEEGDYNPTLREFSDEESDEGQILHRLRHRTITYHHQKVEFYDEDMVIWTEIKGL